MIQQNNALSQLKWKHVLIKTHSNTRAAEQAGPDLFTQTIIASKKKGGPPPFFNRVSRIKL